MGTLSVQPPSGASRSLTEVFILLRNNAIQSRQIFSNPVISSGRGDDRMSLIPLNDGDEGDVEAGLGSGMSSRIPPEWVNMVDEVQYEMTRVRTRLKEVKELQQKHTMRPSFSDDSSLQEETKIEGSTQEITKMLNHCQRLIQHIKGAQHSPKRRGEQVLLKNVVASLVQSLQQLTLEFRQSQTGYLKQIQNREDSFNRYFEAFSAESPTSSAFSSQPVPVMRGVSSMPLFDDVDQDTPGTAESGELTMAQIQAMEENTALVKEREREVLNITKSIVELNTIFKDLAGFVVDQGTVLDRIDYNIEQSNVRVKSALQSVKKAEQYQKKNRKMLCIACLSISIVVLLVLLIFQKSLS